MKPFEQKYDEIGANALELDVANLPAVASSSLMAYASHKCEQPGRIVSLQGLKELEQLPRFVHRDVKLVDISDTALASRILAGEISADEVASRRFRLSVGTCLYAYSYPPDDLLTPIVFLNQAGPDDRAARVLLGRYYEWLQGDERLPLSLADLRLEQLPCALTEVKALDLSGNDFQELPVWPALELAIITGNDNLETPSGFTRLTRQGVRLVKDGLTKQDVRVDISSVVLCRNDLLPEPTKSANAEKNAAWCMELPMPAWSTAHASLRPPSPRARLADFLVRAPEMMRACNPTVRLITNLVLHLNQTRLGKKPAMVLDQSFTPFLSTNPSPKRYAKFVMSLVERYSDTGCIGELEYAYFGVIAMHIYNASIDYRYDIDNDDFDEFIDIVEISH